MTAVVQTPDTSPRWVNISYWGLTGLFCLAMLGGAIGDLARAEPVIAGLTGLGYPPYLATILGICKLLGVAALLYPGFYRLKEWAYAGFTFNLLGAFASHLFAGDPLSAAILPFILWAVMAASYAFHYMRTS